LSAFEELLQLIMEGGRRIFVAQNPVDLTMRTGRNCVYVLELPSSAPGAAGGRIGGLGERRIQRLKRFQFQDGVWSKNYETDEITRLESFELPYHAAGIGVTVSDGPEKVVSGVIDPELVESYDAAI
jgi:hypothetical protein